MERPETQDIGTVEDRFFTIRDFRLADGEVMPRGDDRLRDLRRGAPCRWRRNAVLITHGYTGSHHAAGRNPANGNQPGSWDGLIGPGKAIDTDKLFVVASEHARLVLRLDQRRQHRPEQPASPTAPISRASRCATSSRRRRRCSTRSASAIWSRSPARPMAATRRSSGPSPIPISWMRSCRSTPRPGPRPTPTSSSPRCRRGSRPSPNGTAAAITAPANARTVLTEIRIETLKRYGIEACLARAAFPTRQRARRRSRDIAANWAKNWDANSLLILRRALLGFDTRPDFATIKAKVLYVLCRTDALFPPKIAPGGHRRAARGRGRGALFRDRQRSRPFVERPRARANGRRCCANSWRRWSPKSADLVASRQHPPSPSQPWRAGSLPLPGRGIFNGTAAVRGG